jgi:hypothetical protein
MGSLKRKLQRNRDKSAKKSSKKDISQKMGMFDNLPDNCSACAEPFDKKNRDMVSSWNVVVRNDEKLVRLYCPTCWSKAKEIVQEYTK